MIWENPIEMIWSFFLHIFLVGVSGQRFRVVFGREPCLCDKLITAVFAWQSWGVGITHVVVFPCITCLQALVNKKNSEIIEWISTNRTLAMNSSPKCSIWQASSKVGGARLWENQECFHKRTASNSNFRTSTWWHLGFHPKRKIHSILNGLRELTIR